MNPMTIASAQKLGLKGIEIVCRHCQRSGLKSFPALRLPAETPIPAIATVLNFVCSQCGSRQIVSRPDWTGYNAPGMGGMSGAKNNHQTEELAKRNSSGYIPDMPRLSKYSRKPDGFILPAQPKLIATPPSGPDWLHEVKYDGYRLLAVKKAQSLKLWARSGHDWSDAFTAIRDALMDLPHHDFAIDGEVVSALQSFYGLRSRENQRQAHLYAFDLLQLDGEDLRRTPLIERKKRLAQVLPAEPGHLHFVEHLDEDGPIVFRHACNLGLEGIVSKRRHSTYRSGPTRTWVKTKNIAYDRRKNFFS